MVTGTDVGEAKLLITDKEELNLDSVKYISTKCGAAMDNGFT